MTKINWKEVNKENTEVNCGDWIQVTDYDGERHLLVLTQISGRGYKLINIDEDKANRHVGKEFMHSTITFYDITNELSDKRSKLEKVNVEINVTNES